LTNIRFLLLIYLIMATVMAMLGCITEEQAKKGLTESLHNIKTYTYEMEMNMETGIAGENSYEVVQSTTNGQIDVEGKKVKLSINTNETTSDRKKSRSTQTQIYIFDTMEYLHSSSSEKSGKWIKFQVPGERLNSENQAKRQMDFLRTSKIKRLKDETLENVDCYLLNIESDKKDFWKVIMQQEEEHPLLKLLNLDYKDVVKEMDMKVWVAKDTFLPMKCHMQMKAVIEGEIKEEPFKMTINVKTVYRYHDYNKLLTIELPEEAKNAEIYKEELE
jgi:outer membrane lipoprotein-sorting protein